MQQSATNTCGQYFGLFTDCLMANNDDRTACSDSLFGYQDCNKYTSVIPGISAVLSLSKASTECKLTPTVAATTLSQQH